MFASATLHTAASSTARITKRSFRKEVTDLSSNIDSPYIQNEGRIRIVALKKPLSGQKLTNKVYHTTKEIGKFSKGRRFVRRVGGTGNQRLPALQEAFPVHHDKAAAGVAADTDVRASAEDRPLIAATGMGLPAADHVAGKNQFSHRPPFRQPKE